MHYSDLKEKLYNLLSVTMGRYLISLTKLNKTCYILLTVLLDVILVNEQLDALFLNVFISPLYMFRATNAHHQEG
jgi:hypothetical protein